VTGIADRGYSFPRCRRLLRRRGIPHTQVSSVAICLSQEAHCSGSCLTAGMVSAQGVPQPDAPVGRGVGRRIARARREDMV